MRKQNDTTVDEAIARRVAEKRHARALFAREQADAAVAQAKDAIALVEATFTNRGIVNEWIERINAEVDDMNALADVAAAEAATADACAEIAGRMARRADRRFPSDKSAMS